MAIWRFEETGVDYGQLMTGEYNILVVVLSVLIACVAGYTAMVVADRMHHAVKAAHKYTWLAVGAFAMGLGIWAMHFTGMIAFSVGMQVGYSIPITILSVVPAILGSALVLNLLSVKSVTWQRNQISAVCLATCIAFMHYTGMEAMRMSAILKYDVYYFLLSIVVAHLLASLALYIKYVDLNTAIILKKYQTVLSSIVIGFSISGMHYMAMTATRLYFSDILFSNDNIMLGNTLLFLVIAITILILIFLIILAYVSTLQYTRSNTNTTTESNFINPILIIVILAFTFFGSISLYKQEDAHHNVPIKVGVLHSLTGTMAISESSVVDATQMAIDEINAEGGLLGRRLETVVVDGKSDWPSFASGAEILINQEKVSVIFGCWTSASRKLVKSIVEQYDHLLFYPVQYEGLEQSHNIIYTGATPNQQISPAVKWSIEHLGKRVYLAASDYVFPRAANTLIKKQLVAIGAEVAGEYYLPLGSSDVSELIDDIANSQADVILNTINGDSNLAFFQQLHDKEIETPVMSFSIAEDELQQMDIEVMIGHYGAWNYFQSLDTPENQHFVANFKKKYGANRTTNASMEAAYLGVRLWAKAVIHANTTDTSTVRQTLKGESYLAPEGKVTISALNNHLWKPLHIGQIQADGQFKIIWSKTEPIRPLPYPSYRTQQSWQSYLDGLYQAWGNNWAAPISDHPVKETAL